MTYINQDLQTVLESLSDPTRRAVLDLVRSGISTAGAVADQLPVSRPAVSQHLKHLLEAGLVQVNQNGVRRHYRVEPNGLAPLKAYLDTMWSDVLIQFADFVEEEEGHSDDE